MQRIALFPGSFDPFTIGHKSVVERMLPLFDKIIIAIGINVTKNPYLSVEQRVLALQKLYADEPRVEVVTYSSLTCDLAEQYGAKFIVRGVRSVADFEYERSIADANYKIAGLETLFVMADPELAYISSSLVRELAAFGRDVSNLLPKVK